MLVFEMLLFPSFLDRELQLPKTHTRFFFSTMSDSWQSPHRLTTSPVACSSSPADLFDLQE